MADLFRKLEGAALDTTEALNVVLESLLYNEAGLIPAITQDADSGDVLMLAWMNRTAIERTLSDGRGTYFSRSRGKLWQKGETSGHFQDLVEMRFDCDGDAILLRVRQQGPACHTNRPNCFYLRAEGDRVRVISAPA